jgi:hypothetical protein
MLSVVEKMSFSCHTPEARKAVAELFRFLGTLSRTERVALDNVVGSWYGATMDCGPLMAASEKNEDFALAARLLDRLAQSNGHEVKLEPSAAVLPATIASPEDGNGKALIRRMARLSTIRPSRINSIRRWLLTLPKGSVVTYEQVASRFYGDHPARAGSCFTQLCGLDKVLKKVGHAKYQLTRNAATKLRKGLTYFDGDKYAKKAPDKTLFD